MRFKKLTPDAITPTRGTTHAAGLDLYALRTTLLPPNEPTMVHTGIAVEIPEGYVGLLFARSSMGHCGVSMTNAVGVIDADYRGEIMLSLRYTSGGYGLYNVSHGIAKGERIGQLVVVPAPLFELEEVEELSETARGEGGFGSTGK